MERTARSGAPGPGAGPATPHHHRRTGGTSDGQDPGGAPAGQCGPWPERAGGPPSAISRLWRALGLEPVGRSASRFRALLSRSRSWAEAWTSPRVPRGRDGGSAGEPWLGAWTGAGGAVIGSLHRHIGDGARPFWPGVDRKGPPDPDDPSSLATPSSTPPPPPIVPHRPVGGAGREVDPAGSRRSTPRRLLEAIASFGRRISGVGHER